MPPANAVHFQSWFALRPEILMYTRCNEISDVQEDGGFVPFGSVGGLSLLVVDIEEAYHCKMTPPLEEFRFISSFPFEV